jgi:hypothetical protein
LREQGGYILGNLPAIDAEKVECFFEENNAWLSAKSQTYYVRLIEWLMRCIFQERDKGRCSECGLI